jgi:hypothetical protein
VIPDEPDPTSIPVVKKVRFASSVVETPLGTASRVARRHRPISGKPSRCPTGTRGPKKEKNVVRLLKRNCIKLVPLLSQSTHWIPGWEDVRSLLEYCL